MPNNNYHFGSQDSSAAQDSGNTRPGEWMLFDPEICLEHERAVKATLAEQRHRFETAYPAPNGLQAWYAENFSY